MSGELVQFPISGGVSSEQALRFATDFLDCPAGDRASRAAALRLGDAETLLALCQLLDQRIETGPGPILEAARSAYEFVERSPEDAATLLFDEREYYLGELARIAGCCCRFLTLRSEARQWLDRANTWFLLTANSAGDCARVMYQRLALYMDERNLVEVGGMSGPLIETFERMGARELALKCRYVQAVALRESGQLGNAALTFEQVYSDARQIKSDRVLSATLVALVQTYSDLGNATRALELTIEAETYLQSIGDKVSIAKLRWGVGLLLRKQGRPGDALDAFRSAQSELLGIGLEAESAALHLVIADLLLDQGQERQAEWEIRAALPVIDEHKMVPEGFAAMSLLRESLRRRSIDRQALRKLHGYFEEVGS